MGFGDLVRSLVSKKVSGAVVEGKKLARDAMFGFNYEIENPIYSKNVVLKTFWPRNYLKAFKIKLIAIAENSFDTKTYRELEDRHIQKFRYDVIKEIDVVIYWIDSIKGSADPLSATAMIKQVKGSEKVQDRKVNVKCEIDKSINALGEAFLSCVDILEGKDKEFMQKSWESLVKELQLYNSLLCSKINKMKKQKEGIKNIKTIAEREREKAVVNIQRSFVSIFNYANNFLVLSGSNNDPKIKGAKDITKFMKKPKVSLAEFVKIMYLLSFQSIQNIRQVIPREIEKPINYELLGVKKPGQSHKILKER